MANTGSIDRKRDRLDQNRRLASEADYTPHDIRRFDKLTAKRDNPNLPQRARLRAADELLAMQARHKEERDARWREGALEETVALSGGSVRRRPQGGAQRDGMPGVSFLAIRGRLQPHHVTAASRYSNAYQTASGSIRSVLNDEAPSDPSSRSGRPPAVVTASLELSDAHKRGLFNRRPWIIICDQVCGQGLKVTDLAKPDQRGRVDECQVAALEERLRTALEMLALHWGIAVEQG